MAGPLFSLLAHIPTAFAVCQLMCGASKAKLSGRAHSLVGEKDLLPDNDNNGLTIVDHANSLGSQVAQVRNEKNIISKKRLRD